MRRYLLGTVACLLALPALAQEERSTSAGAGVNVGGVQAGVQANVSQQASAPVIVKVDGGVLMDQAGKELGQIQQLILNPGGCVDLAVLSLGRNKLVPIPWQLVKSGGTASGKFGLGTRAAFVATIDRSRLEQAPSFNENQITQITQQQTIQQVYNFYGVQSQSQGAGGTSSQTSGVTGGATSTSSTNTGVGGTTGTTTNTNTLNRPGRGLGRPENRPPDNRPPTNRPPDNRPPENRPPDNRPAQDNPGQGQP